MLDPAARADLINEFPELEGEDVILQKEMYAHFGLLFFAFALVEHSLINIITFEHVGLALKSGKIKSRSDWEEAFDFGYNKSRKMTFGNLINNVEKVNEFKAIKNNMDRVKKYRDYFTHHFFREEVSVYMTDEGCWKLLYEFKKVRDQVHSLEHELKAPFDAMRRRLNLPLPTDDQLSGESQRLLDETKSSLTDGTISFGWMEDGQNR